LKWEYIGCLKKNGRGRLIKDLRINDEDELGREGDRRKE
jgi:hypothetical protein